MKGLKIFFVYVLIAYPAYVNGKTCPDSFFSKKWHFGIQGNAFVPHVFGLTRVDKPGYEKALTISSPNTFSHIGYSYGAFGEFRFYKFLSFGLEASLMHWSSEAYLENKEYGDWYHQKVTFNNIQLSAYLGFSIPLSLKTCGIVTLGLNRMNALNDKRSVETYIGRNALQSAGYYENDYLWALNGHTNYFFSLGAEHMKGKWAYYVLIKYGQPFNANFGQLLTNSICYYNYSQTGLSIGVKF